ncbi:protein of unknown function [Paraburkholderia kururiensis]
MSTRADIGSALRDKRLRAQIKCVNDYGTSDLADSITVGTSVWLDGLSGRAMASAKRLGLCTATSGRSPARSEGRSNVGSTQTIDIHGVNRLRRVTGQTCVTFRLAMACRR